MKYDANRNEYTLDCTGRTFCANCGMLNPASNGRLSEGYDDVVEFYDEPLTADERREIAEHAIAEWRAWAETGLPETPRNPFD